VIHHQVLTTEKVPFRYQVAGLGSRLLAWLVDTVLWVLLAMMGLLVMVVLETGRPGFGQGFFFLWIFALLLGYGLLFEWLWHGWTPGKRLVGIRVVRWDGTAIGFSQSAVRNLLRLVDNLPLGYGLAFVVAIGNRERRRLGDLAAGTLVVYVEEETRLILPVIEGGMGGGEADRARLAVLRQRVGQLNREQKQTLLDLCLRRDQLRPAERARLFESAARFLRERLELEPAEFESDEKFILRLAAVLEERGQPEGKGRRSR
jgi:uncharacterized RDD family membrane protein YckC